MSCRTNAQLLFPRPVPKIEKTGLEREECWTTDLCLPDGVLLFVLALNVPASVSTPFRLNLTKLALLSLIAVSAHQMSRQEVVPSVPPELLRGLLRVPGDHLVSSSVVCVLTRFQVRWPWDVLWSYRRYRRLLKDRETVGGLVGATFLFEDLRTWWSLSLWTEWADIPRFNVVVPDHIEAARGIFGRLQMTDQEPQIWSTKWTLRSVSNNLHWAGVDLRAHVTAAPLS
jgi:hypothetical protein